MVNIYILKYLKNVSKISRDLIKKNSITDVANGIRRLKCFLRRSSYPYLSRLDWALHWHMPKNLIVVKQVRTPLSKFLDSLVMWMFLLILVVFKWSRFSLKYGWTTWIVTTFFLCNFFVLVYYIDKKELPCQIIANH
jgi:signal transduction histidine kinase